MRNATISFTVKLLVPSGRPAFNEQAELDWLASEVQAALQRALDSVEAERVSVHAVEATGEEAK